MCYLKKKNPTNKTKKNTTDTVHKADKYCLHEEAEESIKIYYIVSKNVF